MKEPLDERLFPVEKEMKYTILPVILSLILCACSTTQKNTDVDLLALSVRKDEPPQRANMFRSYDSKTGAWRQVADQMGPHDKTKQELIKACEMYLKKTDRLEGSQLLGYTSHAHLWVFIYGPVDTLTVGGGITLFVDAKNGRVVAETYTV